MYCYGIGSGTHAAILLQVVLLGNADDIVLHLCRRLGWDLPQPPTPNANLNAPRPNLKKRPSAEFESEPRRVGNRYVRDVCWRGNSTLTNKSCYSATSGYSKAQKAASGLRRSSEDTRSPWRKLLPPPLPPPPRCLAPHRQSRETAVNRRSRGCIDDTCTEREGHQRRRRRRNAFFD